MSFLSLLRARLLGLLDLGDLTTPLGVLTVREDVLVVNAKLVLPVATERVSPDGNLAVRVVAGDGVDGNVGDIVTRCAVEAIAVSAVDETQVRLTEAWTKLEGEVSKWHQQAMWTNG